MDVEFQIIAGIEETELAICKGCGKKLGFLESGSGGYCTICAFTATISESDQKEIQEISVATQKRETEIEAVILTTETAPNLPIKERIEIVTAECAFGMNLFKDLFAGVRDIVGGRSEAVQNTMRDARRTALYELKKEAHAVGANAVVGVDLDYVELSAAGSMVMLVASGTAVLLE
nr:YbjQ family protein [Phaeobacter sp. J2-8]